MQTHHTSDGPHGVLAFDNNDVKGANGEEESRGGKKPRRTYVCQTCQKSFKRREHCMRHERGHTKEKPYLCRYCKRSYARRDLVTRHEKSIHPDQWTAPLSSKGSKAAVTMNGIPPQDPENDESASSNALDDASPDDGQSANGGGLSIHIPLTPREMGGTQEAFTLPEGFIPSTPPSLEDILSLHNGFGGQYGHLSSISTDFMDTSPALNVTINPFDAFQAIAAVDSMQRPSEYLQHSSSQYVQMSNDIYSAHSQMANYPDPSLHRRNSRRDSSITQLYSWADMGAAHSESPSSIGKISRVPTLDVDDTTHTYLLTSMANHLAPHLRRQFRLPSKNIIERCLSSYLTCFHFHFPVVHVASLNLTEAPAPLVLAMCAIGALFRLERKHAVNFRECVDQALASEKLKNSSVGIFSSWPTWMAQCKLLSLFVALFSGDQFTVTLALQSMGSLTTEYRHRRIALAAKPDNHLSFSWSDWIERETSKRILYGTFALSNLVNITFGTTPRMSIVPDAEIEMPDDERLWDASSEGQWTELMVLLGPIDRMTMRSALNQIISGKDEALDFTNRLSWSSFSATVIMHAMNIYVWHLVQSSQAISVLASDGDLKSSLLYQAESALARCSELFLGRNPESEQRLNELEVSQRSNCNALLRTAYVRAANSQQSLERMLVMGGDQMAIEGALQTFIASQQHRSEFVTKAVSAAYQGLQTSVRAGHLLVKKTAAFKWSIDHAIADWDCILFVSRWIHTLERQQQTQPPTPNELKNLSELRQLLSDVDIDFVGQPSLAAAVTRLWAGFFDDTWVWGITPRMAIVMRQLADAYEGGWGSREMND